jgi:hypothetical protein
MVVVQRWFVFPTRGIVVGDKEDFTNLCQRAYRGFRAYPVQSLAKCVQMGKQQGQVFLEDKLQDPRGPTASGIVFCKGKVQKAGEEFGITKDIMGHFLPSLTGGIYIIQLFF